MTAGHDARRARAWRAIGERVARWHDDATARGMTHAEAVEVCRVLMLELLGRVEDCATGEHTTRTLGLETES